MPFDPLEIGSGKSYAYPRILDAEFSISCRRDGPDANGRSGEGRGQARLDKRNPGANRYFRTVQVLFSGA